MFRELDQNQAIFDLPAARFYRGDEELDYSVSLHGHRASSPLGPAAGPQTQMAQNLVLSWLGGCRIMELKTVQIIDDLEIPRPCIDVHTVGLNAEWSQELTLEQSLDEYVKGAMLIQMLREGPLRGVAGFEDTLYDMSVGYDLEGIKSDRVMSFIRQMMDATDVVDRFRREIPASYGHLRDLDYPTELSDSLTLSTFHGCPPEEIEGIIDFLLREVGLHSIIKFNPMLLGRDEVHRILFEVLGYTDLEVPDSAFERDIQWNQAVDMLSRLSETAASEGLGLGAKLTNTLIVRNTRGFLAPEEEEVYLSGQPLHVLAISLVGRFRETFGSRYPISFAAGIDKDNYPDAVALGMVPITTCTDLLRKGGYGRLTAYHAQLKKRMEAVGAQTIGDYILRAYGNAEAAFGRLGIDPRDSLAGRCLGALTAGADLLEAAGREIYDRWVAAASCLNTSRYVEVVMAEERYTRESNSKGPKKIGRHLKLFDCLTCDICVPVCPNDANFTFGSDQKTIAVVKAVPSKGGWEWRHEEDLNLEERHQIGNFADFCNDCGNCDIFCPEDGGPYVLKPRFFGVEAEWRSTTHLDGFYIHRNHERDLVLGRFEGREYRMEATSAGVTYSGDGFEIRFDPQDPQNSLQGEGSGEVDVTFCNIMDYLRRALLDAERVNYVQTLSPLA